MGNPTCTAIVSTLVARVVLALGGAMLLIGISGCQTIPQNEGAPATVAEVVTKIKQDLGKYQEYDDWASGQRPTDDACNAVVGFAIDNVKIALTTATDNTVAGSAGATLPVSAATLGLTGGLSQQVKGTQTITFSIYPPVRPPKGNVPKPIIDAAMFPIAANLAQLREGLVTAGNQKPCISLIPPPAPDGKTNDPGGNFAFGFAVIKTTTGGITIKLVVFSLGASETAQQQASNTITVTFKARPGSAAAALF